VTICAGVSFGWKPDIDISRLFDTQSVQQVSRRVEFCRLGAKVFRVTGGDSAVSGLTAQEAATKARALRRLGQNDVEIFGKDGTRISIYTLDQIIRSGTDQLK